MKIRVKGPCWLSKLKSYNLIKGTAVDYMHLSALQHGKKCQRMDKLISKFIWHRKRPRIRLKILLLPKEKGGLGLPNLQYYYRAAQLNAVVAWIKNDQETGWAQIEQSTTRGISLSILPFINMKSVNSAN